MSRRTARSRAAAALRAACLAACAAAAVLLADGLPAADKHVVAQGRVLAPSGEAMADWPVLLIATQRYIELKHFSSGGDVVTQARVRTDANGYYSIDVVKDRHFQYWFLRFAEQGAIDTVKYLVPDDVEITADARRGRVASVDMTIRPHKDWPEVQRRVSEAGGETTARGRILRSLGLPEKTVRDDAAGTEEWWYFTRGILYTFQGAQAVAERRFEPVKPAAPPKGGPAAAADKGGR